MIHRSFAPHFVVKTGIHGLGVFSLTAFKEGDMLFRMKGELLKMPTRTSVQIGDNLHIEDEIAGFINHSCMPNAKIDKYTHSFVALRDIAIDEEIVFDNNINEDSIASPFVCECCNREIAGKRVSS
jgi:SET domain-containing protein